MVTNIIILILCYHLAIYIYMFLMCWKNKDLFIYLFIYLFIKAEAAKKLGASQTTKKEQTGKTNYLIITTLNFRSGK